MKTSVSEASDGTWPKRNGFTATHMSLRFSRILKEKTGVRPRFLTTDDYLYSLSAVEQPLAVVLKNTIYTCLFRILAREART